VEWTSVFLPAALFLAVVVTSFYVLRGAHVHNPFRWLHDQRAESKAAATRLETAVKGVDARFERLGVQSQLALALTRSGARVTDVSCALSAPKTDATTSDRYRCIVTYRSGRRGGWCAAFDADRAKLVGYVKSARMCGSPSAGA
jgi:hypothetical protein